jgi:hypothetical protein
VSGVSEGRSHRVLGVGRAAVHRQSPERPRRPQVDPALGRAVAGPDSAAFLVRVPAALGPAAIPSADPRQSEGSVSRAQAEALDGASEAVHATASGARLGEPSLPEQ